jgi:hypothetical protein
MADPMKKSISVKDVMGKDDKAAKPKMEKSDKPTAGGSKRKHKHTHIEHHEDGSHTVRHTPMGGGEEVSYSKPDLDGVHDGLEEHVGEANGDEGQMAAAEPQAMPTQGAAPQGAAPGQGA